MSGCSIGMDVEALLRPPHPIGEQKQIQKALEAYIKIKKQVDKPDMRGNYILKYPKSGEYRSSFVIKDVNGDGKDEAIVFYSLGTENSMIHLNLLKNTDDGWKSISDIEGISADIDRIQFGDLNGDGMLEVLTGWNIDLSNRQLVMYSLDSGVLNEWYKELYTEFVVGRLTDSGRDSLLILHSNATAKTTTAKLMQTEFEKKTNAMVLAEIGSTRLDGSIQQFLTPVISRLSDSINGVYVDGLRSSGGMVTELIYWDGLQLLAPFYDSTKNRTILTYRDTPLPSRDMQGDGEIKWPATQTIAGYEYTESDKVWFTRWNSWSVISKKVTQDFSCIINMSDGYYFQTDEEWDGRFTFSYDKNTRTLALHTLENDKAGNKFLMIRAVYRSALNSKNNAFGKFKQNDDAIKFQELDQLSDAKFMVWYSDAKPFNLNLDRISYRFSYLQ